MSFRHKGFATWLTSHRSDQHGVTAALALLVVMMLASMAMAGYFVAAVDKHVALQHLRSTQAAYFAEAGVEFVLKQMYSGETISDLTGVPIASGQFDISATAVGNSWTLTSTGRMGSAIRRIQVSVYYRPPLANFAIYATDDVVNTTALNEDGDPDPSLIVANADSLPPIDYAGLVAMAAAQGHVQGGANFMPSNGYPNGSFYYSGNTPNVTHVTGNLKVLGGRTIYGIFIVEGDVTLNGNARVQGVIYLQDPGSVIAHGGGAPSESVITGGVIINGDVSGTGNHIKVQYDSEYMTQFGSFEDRQGAVKLLSWQEL